MASFFNHLGYIPTIETTAYVPAAHRDTVPRPAAGPCLWNGTNWELGSFHILQPASRARDAGKFGEILFKYFLGILIIRYRSPG